MTGRPGSAPLWLSLPALALYGLLLAVPLTMTLVLSVNLYDQTKGVLPAVSAANYTSVLGDPYFHRIFLRTLRISLITTIVAALIGTPEAWILSRLQPRWRGLCLLAVLGPLLISVVVRTLGWTILLGRTGLINQALGNLGLIDRPVELLFTETGIVIALVHVLVPFVVIAVWTALQQVDPAGERAALSLGASERTVFFRIVLPQIMPGVLSGSVIVFSLAASAFATPALIGGRRLKVVATAIYDEFLGTLDWPLGAAIAVLLVVSVVAIVLLWNRLVERRTAAVLG
ncbi:ABC transporter permease [Aliidongia dinghuensis]|uniref:ABC transporter permease n=1 Tax=Aliidongia dinghuensis TaxID=1867774 RepID=A0A8J3E1V3_9PROT|nr:ABC transporter permease [Aliidongia dinghuensis]GGF04540.1 ABC transporter permease [Aliidongia dinghuensis]